jgi:hypothetical protein
MGFGVEHPETRRARLYRRPLRIIQLYGTTDFGGFSWRKKAIYPLR